MSRPPFIVRALDVPERSHTYPNSDEPMAPSRAIGRAAGLRMVGLHLVRVPPGYRTSWPHAESGEEEFAYVIEGEVDCWIDGHLHHMVAGDLVAWPAGTGIAHCIINNGDREALLLAGGESARPGAKITYPLHPQRRADMPWSLWWDDAPPRELGPHDGLPDARRTT
jgi:uncharacterized cupin superfamily protein